MSTPFVWSPQHHLTTRLTGKADRFLQLSLTGHGTEWIAFAVEIEVPDTVAVEDVASAVLDNHAHHLVGEFADFALAQRAAERYGRQWLRSQKKATTCRCTDIEARKKPSKKRKASRHP